MLKQRIVTAIILAIIVVGSIMQTDTIWTQILFAAFLFAATRELILLTLHTNSLTAIFGASLFVAFYWVSGSVVGAELVYWQSLLGVVMWVLIVVGLL